MNKDEEKICLILLIPALIFLISDWIVCNLPAWHGESLDALVCLLPRFGIPFVCFGIEIIIFLITKKFIFKRVNEYKLVFIVLTIAFIALYFIGGYDGFIYKTAYLIKNSSFCSIMIKQRLKDQCVLDIEWGSKQRIKM